jgi:protein TonB
MSVRLDHGEDTLDEVHKINVTPFIDVMLVLLIIFMVAAPLATVDIGVNLPASTAQPRPERPLFLTVKSDLTLALGETPSAPSLARDARRRGKRQGHAHFPARRQGGAVRRRDGGHEPLARCRVTPRSRSWGSRRRHDGVERRRSRRPAPLGRSPVRSSCSRTAPSRRGVVNWREEIEPAEPAAAIVIEFAPLPVGPAAPQTESAPGPEQVMSEASPGKPVERVEDEQKVEEKVASRPLEEPPPEIKPAPNLDVAVEPPQQEVTTSKRQEPRVPAPTTSAPQALPERSAAIPAAPMQGRLTPNTSNAVPTWKTEILALLERNKRYPHAAQPRREQGIAQVFFRLDRQGRVIDSRIARSSGANRWTKRRWRCCAARNPFRRRRGNCRASAWS